MPSETCKFCNIVSGEGPCVQLYTDNDTTAFMDKYPANDGHCLVISKAHYHTIFRDAARRLRFARTQGD